MQPKRIIIPFDFNNDIFSSLFIANNIHNYNELFKQIFDVMTPDFVCFCKEIEKLPKTDNFLITGLNFNRNEMNVFKDILKTHALNIYFTCFNYKLFIDNSFDYILESVYQDFFVIYHIPSL